MMKCMEAQQGPKVAVLLATYNGSRFVETQIRSLKDNATRFTLHWLDDHSLDSTREIVRSTSQSAGIDLKEWHQPGHKGWPRTFFQLVACVEADIYLFCDQDDIWQSGKIDVAVNNLLPDIEAPVLCFSLAWVFEDNNPGEFRKLFSDPRFNVETWSQRSRVFTTFVAQGNTIGFTRTLREIFLQHKEIADEYAVSHDWWMFLIAKAAGTTRVLHDAPTTLHRRHGNNASEAYIAPKEKSRIAAMWHVEQKFRKHRARIAKGFLLAIPTLPSNLQCEQLANIARLMANIDQRQSPLNILRIARYRAMWPTWSEAIWGAVIWLLCNSPHEPLTRERSR